MVSNRHVGDMNEFYWYLTGGEWEPGEGWRSDGGGSPRDCPAGSFRGPVSPSDATTTLYNGATNHTTHNPKSRGL